MRLTIAAIVLVGLPAVVTAQTRVPSSSGVPSQPAIGLPLPRIGLPLAPIGLPPTIGTQPRGRIDAPGGMLLPAKAGSHNQIPANAGSHNQNRHRRSGRNGSGRSNRSIVFLPVYGWPYGYAALEAAPSADAPIDVSYREPERVTGGLRLEVEPEQDAELYVDGYYVGTLDDVDAELEIEAGQHRIEIRAPGFAPLELNVRISPGRSITYRGELKREKENPAAPAAQPSTVVPPSKTSYFIPGCYLGNVPPEDVRLPATCDVSRLITFAQ